MESRENAGYSVGMADDPLEIRLSATAVNQSE